MRKKEQISYLSRGVQHRVEKFKLGQGVSQPSWDVRAADALEPRKVVLDAIELKLRILVHRRDIPVPLSK